MQRLATVAMSRSRIPSLDGLRAFSILLVLFGHIAGTRHAWPVTVFAYTGDIANFGVRIFFEISGFLITYLLLREQSSAGRVSLPGFYRRRVARIIPPFSVYLLCVVVLAAVGIVRDTAHDFAIAATFTANLFQVPWTLSHFWSLSVEEQFYLIWPVSLILLGRKRAGLLAALVVLLFPALYVVERTAHVTTVAQQFQGIALGCLLALCRDRLHRIERYREILRSKWLSLLPIALLLLTSTLGDLPFTGMPRYILASLCCVFWIDRSITFPGRLLNWEPIAMLGRLSYSLYIWQQLFLDRYSDSAFASFPVNIACAFLCAILSYNFVEQPALRFARQWEARRRMRVAPADALTVAMPNCSPAEIPSAAE